MRNTIVQNTPRLPEPPAEMLAYYQSLHEFITDQVAQLRSAPFEKVAGASGRIQTLPHAASLLDMGYVPFDSEGVAKNFTRIVALLLQNSPANELALTLTKALANGDFGKEDWQEDLQGMENRLVTWADAAKLDVDSLLQLAHWAMSPFWRLAAEQYAAELKKNITNERANCPICGKHADFAVLDDKEHGRRYLACLSCSWQWPFKRMGCSYCGNNDHSELGYILLDDLKGYMIYHCERCKSYLKTFDQRAAVGRLDENPLLENVKTLFLDMIAIEKGYLPIHGQADES